MVTKYGDNFNFDYVFPAPLIEHNANLVKILNLYMNETDSIQEISLKNMHGPPMDFRGMQVEDNEPIGEMMEARAGLPREHTEYYYNGQVLDNDMTLNDYGITSFNAIIKWSAIDAAAPIQAHLDISMKDEEIFQYLHDDLGMQD